QSVSSAVDRSILGQASRDSPVHRHDELDSDPVMHRWSFTGFHVFEMCDAIVVWQKNEMNDDGEC
ncbi:MAG: hypothetical protein ACRER2_15455, partial [Methylococcales bacterium]